MKPLFFALAACLLINATANAQTTTATQNKEDGKELRQNADDTTVHGKKKHNSKAAKREEKKAAKHNKATSDTMKQTKEAKADNKAVKRDEAASRKDGTKRTNSATYPLRKHH